MSIKKDIESFYPLSPMQQGMLFHTLYDDGSGMYVEQLIIPVQSALNVTAFQRAWEQIAQRHSIFRTTFVWENIKTPVQVVHRRVDLTWTIEDWRGISAEEHQDRLKTFLDADRARGFDLAQAPLMRLALFQVADERYQFVWSQHHMLMDGWSLPLVLNEVFALYDAALHGREATLPRPRPYRDYIAWLQQQDLAQAEDFWRQFLAGFTAPTPLGVDRVVGPDAEPADYREVERLIPVETATTLQSLARQHGLTMNTVMQGAWALLLSHYSGEDDVLFGATVSGRPPELTGVESMVGLFINTLPVRVKIDSSATLLDWLKQIQTQQADLRQYEYSPLVQIQGWSDVPRGQTLFESLVVFENYPATGGGGGQGNGARPSLAFGRMQAVERTNYPLNLMAGMGAMRLNYDRRRFDDATIDRMLGHLETVLARVAAQPHQRLADLSLLTAAEQQQQRGWNTLAASYPHDQCLHQLVAAQAAQTPDRDAVVFGDDRLSYAELNSRANQLAHRLQSLGVGGRPQGDARVGLCVERSLEAMVGVLAILKAGGAYVPLDPAYPEERLQFMLADARVPVLLTQQALVDRLPRHDAQVICLDADWPSIAELPTDEPVSQVTPDDLLYVIYTSGSTGQPKGVGMTHRPLVNLLAWQQSTIPGARRTLQFAPLSFDVSCQEIFSAWTTGGTLVLVSEELRRDAPNLLRELDNAAVERIFVPFVALQHLAEQAKGGAGLAHMREIVTAGEQLQITPALARWLANKPECTLHNHYGPTESHVVTAWTLAGSPDTWPALPPIGTPVANSEIWLLNRAGQPVPVGVTGEIHIGGTALARGYLDRPALTADRFVPDGVSGAQGARLYRTGDVGRYRSDGAIEYVGRIDAQVKVRGYRIEVGEIEAVLSQHPAVVEAAVVAREDISPASGHPQKRLVAYVVENKEPGALSKGHPAEHPAEHPANKEQSQDEPGSRSSALGSAELRQFLQARLPEYMIPTSFVFLERLPVTPSGKINRRALPAPDQLRPELADAFIAPRTPVEEMLAQIWAEVLRVDRVGAHDSFFELGGHSLMATQVISRVREVCQVELPLRALFEAPTVAGLAERVANARFESPELIAPPIVPVARNGKLALSFAQQRLWFFDQLQPESAAYNITTALHFEGGLDVTALEQSLNEIVRRHDSLRTVFAPGGDLGQPVQIILPFEPLPLAQIGLDFLPPGERFAEAVQMASEEAERPFDLQTGPLLRATLLHLGPSEHVLLLNMHHIVSDGWSMGVFMREMTALYNAFAVGKASPLPELPIQYADYAVWQRAWLQGDVLSAQLDYWKQQLANVPSLQMPTDYPRPAIATLRGAVQEFALPKALGETLTALSRREGSTLFMTLLTAWQVLLSRYSGQDDIAVGTPIANRTRGEVESLIGYFINTLVLRTDLTGATSFREALQRVRTTALGAYAHQDLPFEQIVDAVQPERDLSRHAIFQVMFVLQNAPMEPIEIPGLRFKPLAIARTTTRFDLTLTMAESPHGLTGVMEYSTDLFSAETITRLIGHFQTLLTEIAAQPAQPLAQLSLLTPGEERQILVDWNATAVEYPQEACIHTLFAEQAARTPGAIAVSFEGADLTYAELDARSNQLAHYLQALGVGPDMRVGVFMERSPDLIVGLLGILKAGGAYLPLDPSYPADRLSFMVADSAAPVLLSQRNLLLDLPEHQAQVVCVDADWPAIARLSAEPVASAATPDHLAYVIYTSGSTGKPKGVMVPHRGVVNFFVGMDRRIGDGQPGSWLAVTSISFDISVLELFWTLTRGFQVVLQREADYSLAASSAHASKAIEFSLFYFASDDRADVRAKYRLLMEGAKFADRNGFTAIWTPERHFHEFGGLYPNPSVTSAAIAAITERVQIRAGSVVLPLHNPIRVAEEWSVVDNMSNGRVGISFASGWHADDFVFAPEHFTTRKKTMLDQIETVRKLWRGEAVPFQGGAGNQVDVRISPRPVQADLPIWLTASGAPETFKTAGALGIGVLTHLLGQSIEQLAEKIALYREAWREQGHPGDGHVTLMLHTFVGKDMSAVRETVREPFTNYLRTSLDLIGNLARSMGHDPNADNFSEDDMAALLEHAFERYFETSSLMGTPETCLQMVDRLKGIGVDEVACLIDFGVEAQAVLESLDYLTLLKERSNRYANAVEDYSVLAQLSRYGISHLQCTPSMANMLLLDPGALTAMLSLRQLMLGGEALPLALAEQLTQTLPAELHNMYGPTETTIWSTTEQIQRGSTSIAIGRPIANTEIYILDRYFQPTPVGIPGDLLIGGDGLVRGYLNRPELTAERFIPHPFGVVPGQRLYKTGDLARYRADGTIEYLGRVDTQVKIRGYRIEVSEIEAVLGEHPEIREAVVVARDDAASGDPSARRLVAYVVPQTTMPAMNLLRGFLEARLPAYMVPAVILELDALPLTPNGKVDRKALPAPEQLRPDLDTAFVAPQTPVEQLLANIWADVLRVGEVGVTDNFFSLGGNSLLATLLVSRMREAFQVDLPVRTLFEAPTINGLAQRILQARTSDTSLLPPPIVPVPREGALPLSFAQQRLWFINRLQPDNPAYNEPTAIRVSGPFNQPALEHTIATIIGRHEALRTTFTIQKGEPVQIIHPLTDLPLEVIDLQHVPEAERDDEARRISREQAHQLFDLERGPLFRVTLLRLSPEDHVILLLLHHIISDGWSNSVIIQELKTLYNAEAKGEPVALPELAVQYADFALWQRAWLQGEVMESHLSYWKQQLAGVTPLDLPTDHPRPSIASFEGAVEPLALPVALRDALNAISRREGVTLFMTMLASFQMLLSRYSGQDDIAVGTPIAGRNMRETETMLGFFINTLVLRTDLSGNPSFREVLARVREVALGAYTHQDLPFEQVVDAVQPERDMSRQPLFQVIFALQNAPAAQLELQDLTISPISIEHTSTKFDLDLSMIETPEGIFGGLHYSTDLFEATTIRRMLQHFTTLLQGIAADPDQRLSALPMLGADERQQLLTAWNPAASEYPRERCVHTIVAENAARTPDAIAVVMPNEQATYAELNIRANQLAHHLQALGVSVGTPVAICLDRSLTFVVGVLAILKAGGAYVPLDPGYPAERLQFMLQDTAAPVLITTAELAQRLPSHSAQVVCVDTDAAELAARPPGNPTSDVTAEHLAYLIYTSGSTGQPKGIGIPHRAITRLVCNTNYVQFAADDHIGMMSNVSFDAATMELWGSLLNGGRMVGIPREVALSPQALAEHIRTYSINTLFMTTALFNQMAREAPAAFASMRDVLFGGEAVDPRAVAQVLAAGRPQRLLHVYGPTESTTYASWYEIAEVPQGATTIPIGYPLANTQLYVLDAALQPVPVGVPGELLIGGDGLAHGYLNQPALTAEKFIPDPYSGVPGGRLYRTGDVVRYGADGAIEFIGRRDHQVKLRGFRIELGEIETALLQHASVGQVAVLAREDQPGNKYLAAYLVPNGDDALNSADLRQFLQGKLPEYMIPNAFVILDALPLTPNGKLDRKALPVPDQLRLAQRGDYVEPRDVVELKLVQIWEEVLNVKPIGAHDNFFDLGGHSLLVVRLMSRIQEEFGRELSLATIFQQPTIEQLACELRDESARVWSPLVPIQTQGSKPPIFCVHPAGGTAFCYVPLSRYLGPDQPVYGLQSYGLEAGQTPYSRIEEIAAYYLQAVREIQPEGPYMLGGWSIGGVIAFEMAQQLRRENQEVALLALMDSELPPPDLQKPDADTSSLLSDANLLMMMVRRKNLPMTPEEFQQLSPEEQLSVAVETAKRTNIIPPDAGPDQVQRFMEVLKGNFKALLQYKAGVYPDQLTYLATEIIYEEGIDILIPEGVDINDPARGWSKHAALPVEVHTVPGDHTTMLSEPHVRGLAEQLSSCISATLSDGEMLPTISSADLV